MRSKARTNDIIEAVASTSMTRARPIRPLLATISKRPLTNFDSSLEISIITPRNPDERGCQISIDIAGRERKLFDAMVAAGVFTPGHAPETPITVRGLLPGEPEKPEWMRVRADLSTDGFRDLKKLMRGMDLNTVCEEAQCPNIYECWESGTSTLMLLGDTCTRACAFCDVKTGRPGGVDLDEPRRAAAAEDERLRAILAYAERLTLEPAAVERTDIDRMRRVGLDDEAILHRDHLVDRVEVGLHDVQIASGQADEGGKEHAIGPLRGVLEGLE